MSLRLHVLAPSVQPHDGDETHDACHVRCAGKDDEALVGPSAAAYYLTRNRNARERTETLG